MKKILITVSVIIIALVLLLIYMRGIRVRNGLIDDIIHNNEDGRIGNQNYMDRTENNMDVEDEMIMENNMDNGNEHITTGYFFGRPQVIIPDEDVIDKLSFIRQRMRMSRDVEREKIGPQSIEEAIDYLTKYVNMTYFPTKCVEYNDIFFFSGGRSTYPVYDFNSGFAIRKGDTAIYGWYSTDIDDYE